MLLCSLILACCWVGLFHLQAGIDLSRKLNSQVSRFLYMIRTVKVEDFLKDLMK